MKTLNQQVTIEAPVELLDFHPVTLAQLPLFQSYFNHYHSRSCDFSIGGVMMWIDYFNYEYAESDGSLYLKGKTSDGDLTVFYHPVGEESTESYLEKIRDYCRMKGLNGCLIEPVEYTPDNEPVNAVDAPMVDNWKEYLYDAEKFLHFAGRKMEKKRNHLNFFLNHYDYTVEPITDNLYPELLDFTREFCDAREDDALLLYESKETLKILKEFSRYPFTGIAIRVDGKIAGYSFGEKIGDTFLAHVEKGNFDYRGIYQALASMLCNEVMRESPEIRYVNREEDMGEDSLRQSKMSYHPSLFVGKRLVKI